MANLNLASRVPKIEITGLSKDEKTVLPSNSSTPALINIESVVDQLVSSGLSGGKLERARTILKLLNQSPDKYVVDKESGRIRCISSNLTSDSNLLDFLIHLQQPTKRLKSSDLKIVQELKVGPHIFANTYAKQACLTSKFTTERVAGQREASGAVSLELDTDIGNTSDNATKPPRVNNSKQDGSLKQPRISKESTENNLTVEEDDSSDDQEQQGSFLPPWASLFGGSR